MVKNAPLWIAIVLSGLLAAAALAACAGQEPITVVEGATVSTGSENENEIAVLFLHHSTGSVIWEGGVAGWFDAYNAGHGTSYRIAERAYPGDGYPWDNYPYDYWNIWVKHAGNRQYKKQDTLELLTKDYDVIVWKHCFPVSAVEADAGSPDTGSDVKSLENYKLQYEALRTKMRQFPETRFIVWTGAALVAGATDEGQAGRAREFFGWVTESWDEPDDNIYVWDFWQLQTEGGLYFLDEYAAGADDSHPNSAFAARVAPAFGQRIVDVIEGRGDSGSMTGQ
ncbi:MAG TPA: hypothetical protein VLC52_09480 [Anaerolineae bacterium]|nr:hypothetical protein [Anaerolineae bacterium]